MKNEVRLIYTIDLFDEAFDRDPWQIQAWSYERKTKAGPVIARVNYANRFEKTGFQLEADAYPRLNGNNYLYINYGFSQSSVFPIHRGGLEWYHNFRNGFEGSAGMRLLSFDPSNVEIYTASLGKYAGNYWLSLRSFVTPETRKTSVTGVLLVRRYFSGSKNYAGLKLGYGNSPDELRNLIDSSQKLSLKTQWIRLEFNRIFAHTWSFGAGATLGREERLPDTFSGYYSFEFSLSKMF
ncbi:MAG: YaiO family outer membrane beta-barrel protein [Bacteroidia bacterium]|nr:YaiO family outer membrane beta-barrel protein [Bacteroidia bacterium]